MLISAYNEHVCDVGTLTPRLFSHSLPPLYSAQCIFRVPQSCCSSIKTAYATITTIKGIEVMRTLRKGQASSFYYGYPLGERHLLM